MIDWCKTEKTFGNVDLSEYRPKVCVRCDECGKESVLTIRVKSRIKNNNINWLCQKCVGNNNSSILSGKTKELWKNTKYRDQRSKFSKKLWEDEEYKVRHSSSVTSEENREKCSKAAIEAWKRDDYRLAHAESLSLCKSIIPSTEVNIIEILNKLNIKYEHQYAVGPYTFDFLIYKDGKPLLLEVNGNYWHTRLYVVKKDRAKESYINNLGTYDFKVIWESQLADKNKVISLIKRWCGISDFRRKNLDLNDLVYQEVSRGECQIFFNNYHYLGTLGRFGVSYGGYYFGDLVCCNIMAHPTRKEIYKRLGLKKDECLELTRLAVSPFYYNKNLCSKFLSKSLTNISKVRPKVKVIVAYSDIMEGHTGGVYKASNWIEDGFTKPSYFYVNNEGWKMHKKTLWNKARGMHVSEREFAKRYEYQKIETPPLIRFLYYL